MKTNETMENVWHRPETETITITNAFHHTKRRVRVADRMTWSREQVRRVRRALCKPDCTCGDMLGARDERDTDPGLSQSWVNKWAWASNPDGTVTWFRIWSE